MDLLTSVSRFLPELDLSVVGEDTRASIARIRVREWVQSGRPGTDELLYVWQQVERTPCLRDNWQEYYLWMCCRQREHWWLDLAREPGWSQLEAGLPEDAPDNVRAMLQRPLSLVFAPGKLDLTEFDRNAKYLAELAYRLDQALKAA